MDKERVMMIIKHTDFDLLSDRDIEFLESVEEQMKYKDEVSEKQEKWLEDIWEQHR